MPIRARADRRVTERQSVTTAEQPEASAVAEPQPPKVTALVVAHNRIDYLRRCLASLEKSEARESIEIIAVDNGSEDGSPALESDFANVRFIRLPRNFGLTKALNIGVRASSGEYIFLLHEDTEVFPDTVRRLVEELDANTEAAAACPRLLTAEGKPAPQLGGFPPDERFEPAEEREEAYPVLYPKGAALILRAFFVKGLGQIDERYGQFGSDAELAFQIRRAGKKIVLVPAARAIHHGRSIESNLRKADFKIGLSVFLGKRK